MNDLTLMIKIGRLLYGDNWQLPIGRALGKYHPQGPRATIDPRLVRRWYAEDRPMPTWIQKALFQILQDEAKQKESQILKIKYSLIEIRKIIDGSKYNLNEEHYED
jgi:hypothetical protein